MLLSTVLLFSTAMRHVYNAHITHMAVKRSCEDKTLFFFVIQEDHKRFTRENAVSV